MKVFYVIITVLLIIISLFIFFINKSNNNTKRNTNSDILIIEDEYIETSILIYNDGSGVDRVESEMKNINLSEELKVIIMLQIKKNGYDLEIKSIDKIKKSNVYLIKYSSDSDDAIKNSIKINEYLLQNFPNVYNVKISIVDNPSLKKK